MQTYSAETYQLEGRKGIRKRFIDDGYLIAEPHPEPHGQEFNIVWASEVSPLEALRKTTMLGPLTGRHGFIIRKETGVWQTSAKQVVGSIEKDPEGIEAFAADGSEAGLCWYVPRQIWTDSVRHYAEIGLMVHGAPKELIRSAIAATAIESVRSDLDQALDEFAEVIPGLR